ncbi:MAG: PL29 family lyase N-terminal domain-containing protein [Candidatus Cryptobacteroides sp.]
MKKFIYIAISLLALTFTACNKYALQEDLESLKNEVNELKTLCQQLNNDVASLNKFMEAYEGCKMITNVVETSFGWTIYFNDGTDCDIRNGIDGDKGDTGDKGDKGDTGEAPVIGIKQDTDGIFYWTLNGEFIVVDGKQIPTTGKDAVAPTFRVNGDNMLQASYDGGESWSDVGKIEGVTTTPSAIIDVKDGEDMVEFVLDETHSVFINKFKPLKISVSAPVCTGDTYTATYTLVGAKEDVQVVCSANGDWKVSVSRIDATSGTLTFTAPAVWEDGCILVFAYSEEQIAMTVVSISDDKIVVSQNEYPVSAAASSFEVPVSANFVPSVSASEAWLTVTETKAMTDYKYTVTVEANPNETERQAVINFSKGEGGVVIGTVLVKQAGKTVAHPVTLSVSASLAGSIYRETSVTSITISSTEDLNDAGDKVLDATSGSVTVLPCTSYDVRFVLANGQAFTYTTALPESSAIALTDIDALLAAGTAVPDYVGLAGADDSARANCYIVLDGGYYKFPADYLNDGTTAIEAASADWLWSEGSASLVSGVSLNGKYVQFCVQAETKGNAVIATKGNDGKISWSWHIWMLQEDPTASVHYARNTTNYPLMNYHLGATSSAADANANGLYYQWGRKDPFPRANSLGTYDTPSESGQFGEYTLSHIENTDVFPGTMFAKVANSTPTDNSVSDITYAIQNPTAFISAPDDSPVPTTGTKAIRTWLSTTELAVAYSLWNNSHDGTQKDLNAIKPSDKTNYDPCPAGYIVPSTARQVWHTSSAWGFAYLSFAFPYSVCAYYTNPTDNTTAYYPASGRRTDGKLQNLGQEGGTWASYLEYTESNGRLFGQLMRIDTPTYDESGNPTAIKYVGSGTNYSSWALPVRCCRIVD